MDQYNMSSYRIRLFLHNFFADHRSSCWLFITSKMKTIQDLHKHIVEIFKLPMDFYLISNGSYLPESQDVRVLKEDDVIIAVPCKPQKQFASVCDSKLEFENVQSSSVSKRSRSIQDESESEAPSPTTVKAKKKKKKKCLENDNVDFSSSFDIDTEVQKKEKKENDKVDFTSSFDIDTKVQKREKKENDKVDFTSSFDIDTKVQKKEKNEKIENLFSKIVRTVVVNTGEKEESTSKDVKNDVCNETENPTSHDYSKTIGSSYIETPACDQKKQKSSLKKSLGTDIEVHSTVKNNFEKPEKFNSKALGTDTEIHPSVKNNFQKPFIKRNKKIELMQISTQPKVVQTIHVTDFPMVRPYSTVESLNKPYVFDSSHKVDNQEMLTPTVNTKNLLFKATEENEISKTETPPSASSKNDAGWTEPWSDENKVIDTSLQSVSDLTSAVEVKKADKENVKSPLVTKLNNNLATGRDISEKVNIISVTTISSEQNQTNLEKLCKSEFIGPQLFPVSKNIQIAPSTDMDLLDEKHDSLLRSLQQNDSLEGFSEVNDESMTDFKDCVVTAPSESAVDSVAEDSSVNVSTEAKRKRKRVRKRKPKAKVQENGFETPICPKPLFTKATPVIHIRFDNEQDEQTESNPKSLTPDVLDINLDLDYEKLCREEIVKYPVLQNKFPKQGDVIAFKICKLSKCYTPEVSAMIIAKVVSFCVETNNVTVKILEGADEFTTPEGKFYLESCSVEEKTDEKDFVWTELIEPRLLFP